MPGWAFFLPLITTNCAVFGACVLNTDAELEFLPALVTSFAYAAGFGLALILFAGVRERILVARVPRPLQDTSIALVTAGIISLSFYAFKGHGVKQHSAQGGIGHPLCNCTNRSGQHVPNGFVLVKAK